MEAGQPRNVLKMRLHWLRIRFPSEQDVSTWIGPALRGMVAKPLRDQACLLSEVTPIEFDHQNSTVQALTLATQCLPGMVVGAGKVDQVRIVVDTPLILKNCQGKPRFADFCNASVRTISRACKELCHPNSLEHVDYRNLKDEALPVVTAFDGLSQFHQERLSRRQQKRWTPNSWRGSLVFQNVPIEFLPWLHWGGRIGVGDSRINGTGTWRLVLD